MKYIGNDTDIPLKRPPTDTCEYSKHIISKKI